MINAFLLILFFFSSLQAQEETIFFEKIYQEHVKSLRHLDEPQPKLLVMLSGTPGMGKTLLAKHLEDHFHGIRINSDDIRLLLKEQDISYDFLNRYIEWCLKKLMDTSPNHLILLDRSVDRTFDSYIAFAHLYHYDTFLIRLNVERKIAEERIRSRGIDVEGLLCLMDKFWKDYQLLGQRVVPDLLFKSDTPYRYVIEQIEKRSMGEKERASSSSSDEIISGLYLGDQRAADPLLLPVSHVLCCRTFPQKPLNASYTWKPMAFPDRSGDKIIPFFDEAYAFIESAKEGVLVHCKEGKSRSASIVIAYLMRRFELSFETAFQFVRNKHPSAEPNPGFQEELKEYGKQPPSSRFL